MQTYRLRRMHFSICSSYEVIEVVEVVVVAATQTTATVVIAVKVSGVL